ncbi:WD40/YVTN/BNR-like repeat-containing protein [Nannocystaceae bacterium ST9]
MNLRALVGRSLLGVAALVCASCRTAPAQAPASEAEGERPIVSEAEPARAAPVRGELPCTVEFDGEQESILVAGVASPIEFMAQVDTRLVAYPGAHAGEVLVAVGYDHAWYPDRTDTGSVLWRVQCATPSEAERALELAGADFPWSVLSPDGQQIYFTYAGVSRYEIATGKVDLLVGSRTIADCWMREDEGGIGSDEFVQGWVGPGELAVLSGGPCGFEAQWEGEMQVLSGFEDPRKPAERRERAWVGALALGAGRRVWVGDGNECALEFNPEGVGTPGVWRSDDTGLSWTFSPIKGLEAGIEAIWPSASDPDRVLAASECCISYADDVCGSVGGGSLFLTTDGGETWKKILDRSANYGIKGVLDDAATHELTVFAGEGSLRSLDEGKLWTPSDATLETPADPRAKIELDGVVLEPGLDGLVRRGPGAAAGAGEIVLRPGPNARG